MNILASLIGLSALLLVVGFVIVLTRKNAIFILIGIELMLNAVNINFVSFSKYWQGEQGQFFSLFIMVVAAAEAAIALAIILKVYHHYKSSDLDHLNELKG